MSIISDIDTYIAEGGGGYPAWYCGIAANPRDRLFNDHRVAEKNGLWIYRDCGTDTVARQVERYFLQRGCQGGRSGGNRSTRYIYSYKITMTTLEEA
jgi:hypothetical protein